MHVDGGKLDERREEAERKKIDDGVIHSSE